MTPDSNLLETFTLSPLIFIFNSSTDDRGLGRAEAFRASMRSAAAVCRELCMAKR